MSDLVFACCKDHQDSLGVESPRDEEEDLSRRGVEPVKVIDDADHRLLLGLLGEEGQNRQSDAVLIGFASFAESERPAQRPRLLASGAVRGNRAAVV